MGDKYMTSNPQQPVDATGNQTSSTTQPVDTTQKPLTSAQQASYNAAEEGAPADSSTTIGSIEELRIQSPEVYKAIMNGMAMNICSQSNKFNSRMKEHMKEMNRESNS